MNLSTRSFVQQSRHRATDESAPRGGLARETTAGERADTRLTCGVFDTARSSPE
jgi:hypothetical protein